MGDHTVLRITLGFIIFSFTVLLSFLLSSTNRSFGAILLSPSPSYHVPISLLVPCGKKHTNKIKKFLDSVANQTRMPGETIVIVSTNNVTEAERILQIKKEYSSRISNLTIVIQSNMSKVTGEIRQMLIDMASNPIITFYDADDWMFRQRTEILYNMFRKNPDLEVLVHCYDTGLSDGPIFSRKEVDAMDLPNIPYSYFWNSDYIKDPFNRQEDGKPSKPERPWILGDPTTEPNHPNERSEVYWFPKGVDMKNMPGKKHNAWITIRTPVSRSVPYPPYIFGEDSLYNWRLQKAHKNFTFIDVPLGYYRHLRRQ